MLSHTLIALSACAVGLALHLRWHPLRRELSDAWDFLRLRQSLLLMLAGAALLAGWDAAGTFTWIELNDWAVLWRPLLRHAFTDFALLFHQLVPPWPLALLLPLSLVLLAVRVWRWPYRYGERMPVPEQKLILVALSAGGVLWLLLEAVAALRPELPEWLQTIKMAARTLYIALMVAGTQVWLARLVIAWEKPPDTDAERDAVAALESTFARWQGVVALGVFNLLWMAWLGWNTDAETFSAWLLPELLILCAALPLAVAVLPGSSPFWQTGAVALRVLLHAALPLLMLAPTALAWLALTRYAVDMGLALAGAEEYAVLHQIVAVVRALVLAMLHGWLCLAALLAMLRHGFPTNPPADPAPSVEKTRP